MITSRALGFGSAIYSVFCDMRLGNIQHILSSSPIVFNINTPIGFLAVFHFALWYSTGILFRSALFFFFFHLHIIYHYSSVMAKKSEILSIHFNGKNYFSWDFQIQMFEKENTFAVILMEPWLNPLIKLSPLKESQMMLKSSLGS